MQLTLINWLLALLPIITVLILMLGFRWGGSKAGAVAWLVAILVAALRFGAGAKLIAYSQGKGLLLTLDVLYIIWTALLLFHTANEAGAVQVIGDRLPALTGNRVMQALLLSWLFVSFLQGMGGFGVPVAVAAPLLVGIGFTPMQSVVMASIGHAWAVTFGSLGTSFATLMATTGLPYKVLAPDAALLLGFSSLTCGMVVAHVTDGWRGIWRGLPALLIISPVMAVVQYLLATNGMWALGATGAGLVGLVVGVGVTRLPIYRNKRPVGDPLLDLTPFQAAEGGSPSPSPVSFADSWRGGRPTVGKCRPKVGGEVNPAKLDDRLYRLCAVDVLLALLRPADGGASGSWGRAVADQKPAGLAKNCGSVWDDRVGVCLLDSQPVIRLPERGVICRSARNLCRRTGAVFPVYVEPIPGDAGRARLTGSGGYRICDPAPGRAEARLTGLGAAGRMGAAAFLDHLPQVDCIGPYPGGSLPVDIAARYLPADRRIAGPAAGSILPSSRVGADRRGDFVS